MFNEHAEQIVTGERELAALMRAAMTRAARPQHRIDREARDHIAPATIELLHKTFITPIDRDDIHQLITRMDDILDLMEDAAQIDSLYDLRAVTPEAKRLAELCVACCEKVSDAVALLTNMDNAARIVAICATRSTGSSPKPTT